MADLTTQLSKFLTSLYASVGTGAPFIVARGRSVAAVAAVASLATYTVGAADETLEVEVTVTVTTATTHSFSLQCGYTDDGNSARTITLPTRLTTDSTALQGLIANGNGAVPYVGVPVVFRAKAGTTVTLMTQAAGTYTTVVYNVEGLILRKA